MSAPASSSPPPHLVLKDEPLARVDVARIGDRDVVFKTYRCPPVLLWRTFLQLSRAAREYRGLCAVHDAGVPCVEPLAWNEIRRWGCVPACSIATGYVPGTRTMRTMLDTPGALSPPERRLLSRRIGALTRALHGAGVLWCTLTPRNILLEGETSSGRLLICDMPKAVRFRRPIVATRRALIDLFDACFSPHRRRQLGRGDRYAMLLAYCDGDRGLARRIWRALAGRSKPRNRFEKGLWVTLGSYLLPSLRLLVRGRLAQPSDRDVDDRRQPGSPPRRAADVVRQAGELRLHARG